MCRQPIEGVYHISGSPGGDLLHLIQQDHLWGQLGAYLLHDLMLYCAEAICEASTESQTSASTGCACNHVRLVFPWGWPVPCVNASRNHLALRDEHMPAMSSIDCARAATSKARTAPMKESSRLSILFSTARRMACSSDTSAASPVQQSSLSTPSSASLRALHIYKRGFYIAGQTIPGCRVLE